jgi:hypothetical protein
MTQQQLTQIVFNQRYHLPVLMGCCLCVSTFSLECSAIATDLKRNFWVLNFRWHCTSDDSNGNTAMRLAALLLPLGSSSHVDLLFHFGPFDTFFFGFRWQRQGFQVQCWCSCSRWLSPLF